MPYTVSWTFSFPNQNHTAFFPHCIAKPDNYPGYDTIATKEPARTKPSGAMSLGGGPQTPRKKVHWCFESSARVGHNAIMARAHDFKRALTRAIEPTGGPGVELATLEDAARRGFV